MPLAWPSILVPSSENWNPNKGASRGGGRGLTNQEQVVALPSGFNTATLTIPCKTPARVLAMRALLASLDGRAGTVLVGPFEYSRSPWATDGYGRLITPKLLRQPALDGTAFADGGARVIADTLIPATMADAAVMNATSLRLALPLGTVFRPDVVSTILGDLVPGLFFEVAGRLHLIVSISGDVVSFRPWLRADLPAGTPVNLVSPKATMRLATDDTGSMELQLSRSGTVTLELVEAF